MGTDGLDRGGGDSENWRDGSQPQPAQTDNGHEYWGLDETLREHRGSFTLIYIASKYMVIVKEILLCVIVLINVNIVNNGTSRFQHVSIFNLSV